MEKDKIIMVASMAPWIHVNKSNGFGNDSVEVTCDENTVEEIRTGTITVSSAGGVVREIYISQAAAEITYEYILEAVV
nr:MAG: Putative binding domain, N-terminal [Bacteriophage sp.]